MKASWIRVSLLGLAALLIEPAEVKAQTLHYDLNGTTTPVAAGEDLTVDVGLVSGIRVLRIWDPVPGSDGLPDDDVGKVRIDGSLEPGGELRILIAIPSETWPTNPTVALEPVSER